MYNIYFKYLLSQNFIKEKHNIKSNNLEISKLAKLRKNKIKISGDNNILHIEDGALIRNCNFMIKGNNVWIGTRVMILKGVKVGDGSIIVAGSIVNKNINSNTIVAGIPAKEVKNNVYWTREEVMVR